jgi:ribosomal protein S6 kinase beta
VRIGPRDFELLSVIGMGAFGKVLQVRSRRNGQICAMKCISKKMLEKKNHASYMKAERDIMARVDHPFIVGLKCAFQTDRKLFLVVSDTPLITSR